MNETMFRKNLNNSTNNFDNIEKNTSISENSQQFLCDSSLSETKIKTMAHIFKNSIKLGSADDLIVYINNRLNEGYISLKTAFEYIDPDHLGHLLIDEFKIVLEEFFLIDTKIGQKNFDSLEPNIYYLFEIKALLIST